MPQIRDMLRRGDRPAAIEALARLVEIQVDAEAPQPMRPSARPMPPSARVWLDLLRRLEESGALGHAASDEELAALARDLLPAILREAEAPTRAAAEASLPTGPRDASPGSGLRSGSGPLAGFEEASASWFAGETPQRPPERIGGYVVVRELSAGGFGRVFEGYGDDELRRTVAIKVLHRGGEEQLKRFVAERAILANLRHPNVARFEASGVLDDGRPWIAMEYVEGLPLLRYCERERPSTEQRLRLFRKICEAVHEAHRWGVVHLDIKPDNVMVTIDGEPKLLDFGIARITRSLDPTTRTAGADGALTYPYSSPEQLRGEPVSTASDVYNLGLLLYELLTGSRARESGATEIEAYVREVLARDPEPPSARVARLALALRTLAGSGSAPQPGAAAPSAPGTSATTSATTSQGGASRLARRLRGDLDMIVMMAMRLEPSRRYPSAIAIAEDLDRHLDGVPIVARRASMGYRVGRQLQRHRRTVLVALLALTALAAILLAAWTEGRLRSEREIAVRDERIRLQQEELNRYLQGLVDADREAFLVRRESDRALDRELGWIRADLMKYPELLELLKSRTVDERQQFDRILGRMEREPALRLTEDDVLAFVGAELKYATLRGRFDPDGTEKQEAIRSLVELEERIARIPSGVLGDGPRGEAAALSLKARLLETRGDLLEARIDPVGSELPERHRIFEEAFELRTRVLALREGDLGARYDHSKCLARICQFAIDRATARARLREQRQVDPARAEAEAAAAREDEAAALALAERLLEARIAIYRDSQVEGVALKDLSRRERDVMMAHQWVYRADWIDPSDLARADAAAQAGAAIARARLERERQRAKGDLGEAHGDLAMALDSAATCALQLARHDEAGGTWREAARHALDALPYEINDAGVLGIQLDVIERGVSALAGQRAAGALADASGLVSETIRRLETAAKASPRHALGDPRVARRVERLRSLAAGVDAAADRMQAAEAGASTDRGGRP